MKIGYACLAPGVEGTDFKHVSLNQVTEAKLLDVIFHNLTSLERLIDYNIEHQIGLFRISSDIIPLASHPVNQIAWWETFSNLFYRIGNKIIDAGMRVSMHPGQYTVINSPREEVVERAIEDLRYHCRFLDALHVGDEHKVILHIGGVYQDKPTAMQRFITQYQRLDPAIKRRLVIENDDAYYTIEEVLTIARAAHIPVVFDQYHHALNQSLTQKSDREWIMEAMKTWEHNDGKPKIHYSEPNPNKRKGAHSDTIHVNSFLAFYASIQGLDLDVMLEVKDKHRSALKILQVIEQRGISMLEAEWSRYKYAVLEHDPKTYNAIRELLKEKTIDQSIEFYQMVEKALERIPTPGNQVNAAEHVWGYFHSLATPGEKRRFQTIMKEVAAGKGSESVKRFLWNCTTHHRIPYLLQSYYFTI